jgi:hypothetical protein
MINNIPFLFPFFFIGIWILATFILAKMGWADLANKYLFENDFIGQRKGIISAGINSVNYKNSLVLKFNDEGIYLRPSILFRLFHKPILIPWSEIKEVRTKKILFFTYKELIIGNPFVAMLTIKENIFKEFEEKLQN